MPAPVISSGHQPGFHHPGILAKRIALAKEAASRGGGSAWLVADQDIDDPEVIRYPDLDEQGNLVARSWKLFPVRRGVPTAVRRWESIAPPPHISDQLPGSIQSGLFRMHEALESAEGETVAARFSAASERLLQDLIGHPTTLVRASELLETEPGRNAVDRILDDPIRCAEVWNEGLLGVPRAARALKIEPRDPLATEVPAWVLDPEGIRRAARAGDLRSEQGGGRRIMPRAFLMTAIFRILTGAPMIHGTGGGRYEMVTDHWAKEFLEVELPPIQVVTADQLLPLEKFAPTNAEPRLRERIRELEHDPWTDAGIKQDWLRRIEECPADSTQRRQVFERMHEAIAHERKTVEARLEKLRSLEALGVHQQARMELARSRTWAWPLHEPVALRQLRLKSA